MKCIWHKGESVEFDEAHIIPEALGFPEGFVLNNGEECKSCNNRLAHLDRALVDSFDVLRFRVGQPTKKGKPPKITSRPNLFAGLGAGGPFIEVNLDKIKWTAPSGRVLSSRRGRHGGVMGRLMVEDRRFLLTLDVPIGHQPALSRALHKVALASLVKLISHEHVLDSVYDPIRNFVLKGIESREVLMFFPQEQWSYKHVIGPLYHSPENYIGIKLVLCGIVFFVDLSPMHCLLPRVKEQSKRIYGETGWTWIPGNLRK